MRSEVTESLLLGQLVTLVRGNTYKSALLGQPGPVLLGLASIQRDGGFRGDSLKSYGGDSAERILLRPGDLFVSLKDVTQSGDLLGSVARVPASVGFGRLTQDTVKLHFDHNRYPPDLLYWTLRCPEYRSYCRERAIGTTNLSLSRDDFLAFPLPAATTGRLELIALLEAIEQRIDLLRQTNATLEVIAQALFRSWFIDFDPVRAKAEGREPEGMDADTAALFPAEFEESALGLIPRGWVHRAAGQLFDVGIGKTPPRNEPQWFSEGSGDARWLSIRDMGDEGAIASRSSEYLSSAAVEKFNVRVVPSRTVLMSFKLTVGRLSITDGPMCTNEAIAHFTSQGDSPPFTYLYCYLKAFDFRTLGSTSSIANATNSKAVKALPVLVPSTEVLAAFHCAINEVFERMFVHKTHWRLLADLRDTLLPRLISGKLRLPEARELVEATPA